LQFKSVCLLKDDSREKLKQIYPTITKRPIYFLSINLLVYMTCCQWKSFELVSNEKMPVITHLWDVTDASALLSRSTELELSLRDSISMLVVWVLRHLRSC